MPSDPNPLRDRPDPSADPLSEVLALLRPSTVLSARLEAGGDWCLRFPASPSSIKFFSIVEGTCWMRRDGDAPRRLEAGDCFLTTRGAPYLLASDLALPEADAHSLYSCVADGRARIGPRTDVSVLGGRFEFETSHAALLLDVLPPVVHVPAGAAAAGVVGWALLQLATEMQEGQAGTTLMRGHLAHMLLLQILRAHLAAPETAATGWLAALQDARIGPAIARLHAEPATRWTLAGLAAESAMSRSNFAARFKALVGLPPLDYLQRLRMLQAARALREGRGTVSAIAASLGYDSDSAFSHAFKRVMGASPSAWRQS